MVIRAKTYNNKTFPIKSNKLFELFLKLDVTLSGQPIKVNSPFSEDKTPSLVIYYSDKGQDDYYRFKCFSTGYAGDAIDLFLLLYGEKYKLCKKIGCSESYGSEVRQDAYYKILEIINTNAKIENFVKSNSKLIIEKEVNELHSFQVSKTWTKERADYWRKHGCQKEFIKEYCIKPLDFYELKKSKGKFEKVLGFSYDLCFGYFTKKGELYKIYNPGQKKGKFVKIKEHIQGLEQLKPNKKYCLIMASLKDVGAFKELGFEQFNCIIPDSENVDLPIKLIEILKKKHKYVFTMFDNDIAGLKRMKHYYNTYQIPYIHFNVEKDFAQCRLDHGKYNTKLFFTQIFKKQLDFWKTKKVNI